MSIGRPLALPWNAVADTVGQAGQVEGGGVVGMRCAYVACLGFDVDGSSVGQAESVDGAVVDSLVGKCTLLCEGEELPVYSLPFRSRVGGTVLPQNESIGHSSRTDAFFGQDRARGFDESHPLRPERLKRTYELLMAYHAFDAPNSHLVAPVPASREELLLFHTAEYVDAVARLSDVLSLSKGDVLSLPKGGGGERIGPATGDQGIGPWPGGSSRCPANCTSPER